MKKNKRIWLEFFLVFCAFYLLAGSFLFAQPEKLIYIRAKKIYTCDKNLVINNGGILIKGKKIIKVEKKSKPPREAQIIDLKDRIIIPGLIDAHSFCGFHEEDFNVQTEPKLWNPFSPQGVRTYPPKVELPPLKVEARFEAAQAVFYGDRYFKKFLTEGITTAKIAIPTDNLVGGTSVCVKLSANSPTEFLLKNPAGAEFCFVVEENVMKRYGDLRKVFLDAIEYRKKIGKYRKDMKKYLEKEEKAPKRELKEPKEPKKDENQERILKILERKIPVMIRASRINEIQAALKIMDEFKIRLILVGGQETYKIAEDLLLRRIPVIAGPEAVLMKKGKKINYMKELLNRNVPVAFCSASGISSVFLPFQLNYAIQHGLTETEALNILTINAAGILGVADRIGSITKGKDADFVVLDGDPFELTTKVKRVYINGCMVYPEEETR